MEVEFTGAALLAEKFAAIRHPVSRDGNLLRVEAWNCDIQFQLERYDTKNGATAVSYRVVTYLEHLMHPVVDYAVGWGKSLLEANEMATETYMGSAFPVIHAICCTSKCGYGVECEVHYHKNEDTGVVDDWRIIQGPPVILSTESRDISREELFNIISPDLGEMTAENGTYWFKCFIGHFDENVEADCFLNNIKWPEKIAEFQEFGRSMPPNTTIKQHILICPEDMECVGDWKRQRRENWEESVAGLDINRNDLSLVLDAFDVFLQYAEMSETHLLERMTERGFDPWIARLLVAYLPNVCSRFVWKSSGVEFGNQVQLFNYQNGLSQTWELKDQPLFQATTSVVEVWTQQGVNSSLIETVSSMGVEQSIISQALEQGAKMEGVRLTHLIIPANNLNDGVEDPELQKLLGFRKRPWWKFW